MPILEDVATDAEVGQGDLLANVSLFEISADGRPAAIAKATHALIVSRDCAVENKPQVLVAAVFANPLQFAKEEDPKKRFEAFRRHLAVLRDGGQSPDRFYLGALPGSTERLVAHLDQLCPLVLPPEAAARREWMKTHRVARLTADFRGAIPVRMFWSFGRVGFDNVEWYPSMDLQGLVDAGLAHLHALELDHKKLSFEHNTAAGGHASTLQDLERQLKKKAGEIAAFTETLAPYETELARRKASPQG